jgi:voltage-gated potassium channel
VTARSLEIQSKSRRFVRRWVARRPGRACVFLLAVTVTVGGSLYSVLEADANWFDGVWWATVTLTTVGYGDYSPHTFLGRWVAAFVMAGGIGTVAILTGVLADEIRQVRLEDADYTATLDDDIDEVMLVLAGELDKLRAKVSHPEVVAALQRAQKQTMKEVP